VITKRCVLVIALHGCESDMVLVFRCQLMGAWPRVEATFAAVEAHSSDIDVIDYRFVVHVGHMHATEVRDRSVVVESATTPVTAFETNTAIAVSVIDSAVEADVRPPIARMPGIGAITPAPVAGCPQ
jgi:hypothetical protein